MTPTVISAMLASYCATAIERLEAGYKVEFEERPVGGGVLYLITKISPRLDEEPASPCIVQEPRHGR